MSDPSNPYKPNDKVFTTIKGAEVEAAVRLVWKNEVQVRVPSGSLVWRTVKTVRAASAPVIEPPPPVPPEAEPPTPAVEISTGSEIEASTVTNDPVPPASEQPNEAEAEAAPSQLEAVEPVEALPQTTAASESLACGVPEVEADRKRSKRNKRRR